MAAQHEGNDELPPLLDSNEEPTGMGVYNYTRGPEDVCPHRRALKAEQSKGPEKIITSPYFYTATIWLPGHN